MEKDKSQVIEKGWDKSEQPSSSTLLITSGMGIGIIGTGAALLTGAVCPLCVIATPSLLGGGIIMKCIEWRKRKTK